MRAGKSGHRSAGSGAGDGGKYFEKVFGVIHPGAISPVGFENLLFHAGPVKAAVREAIDGENVGVRIDQPVPELGKVIALQQLSGSDGGQSQANGKRRVSSQCAGVTETIADC